MIVMSCYPAQLLVLVCTIVTCCNAAEYITAYVKEALTTTTCKNVTTHRGVCNVDWQVSHNAAATYEREIEAINSTVSSPSLTFRLDQSTAVQCRKMYETMLCGTTFPVCDANKMVLDYGNGTQRCENARKACTNVDIAGCEYSPVGERSIVRAQKKCVPLTVDTTKICPHFKMKVPEGSTRFLDKLIKLLSDAADKFESETKNLTGVDECKKTYKEVLCRFISACSPDGYYSLHLISKEECEAKTSCVKALGPDVDIDTSMCATLATTDGKKTITIKNPFLDESRQATTVPAPTEERRPVTSGPTEQGTHSTSGDTVMSRTPTRRATTAPAPTEERRPVTSGPTEQGTHSTSGDTVISTASRRDLEATSELLEELLTKPTNLANSEKSNSSGRGSAGSINHGLSNWFTILVSVFTCIATLPTTLPLVNK